MDHLRRKLPVGPDAVTVGKIVLAGVKHAKGITGLKSGRSDAEESEPVKPVQVDDMANLINAGAPPDPTRMAEVMRKHGLVVLPAGT